MSCLGRALPRPSRPEDLRTVLMFALCKPTPTDSDSFPPRPELGAVICMSFVYNRHLNLITK